MIRIVNGKEVTLSAQEESDIQAEWADADAQKLIDDRQSKIDLLIDNRLDKTARAGIAGQITAIEIMNDVALDAEIAKL